MQVHLPEEILPAVHMHHDATPRLEKKSRRRIAAEFIDLGVIALQANEDLGKRAEAATSTHRPPDSSASMKASRDVAQAKLLRGIAHPSEFTDKSNAFHDTG